jgi:tripartite-type tricarboxylate transporter receptor subunit TctC
VLLNAAVSRKLPFDPIKDFVPIIEIARGSLALAVHKSVEVADAKALIAAAQAKPDEMTYASPGRATPHHFAMELFKLRTATKLRHVPFTGTAGAVQAIVGGHVQSMFIPIHVGLTHAQDGTIKLLGVGSAKRSPQAPNVPTLIEQGIADTEVDLWYGLAAPAGTPADIVARFNAVLNDALADPKVRDTLDKQGLTAVGGTTQAFADLIAKDLPRWRDVVQSAGLAVDE